MGIAPSPVLPEFSGTYDLEQFLKDIETTFKAKLGAEITALNTEKGDFTIPLINDDAWYLSHIPNVFSRTFNIVWGPDSQEITDSIGDNALKTYKVFIEVMTTDDGEQNANHVTWKLLRYTRALERVAHKNFDQFRSLASLKVESLLPTTVEYFGKKHRTAGIRIEASLSAT